MLEACGILSQCDDIGRRADKAWTGRRRRKETEATSVGRIGPASRPNTVAAGPGRAGRAIAVTTTVRLYRFLLPCSCTCVPPSAGFLYRPGVLSSVALSVRLRVRPSVCPSDWPLAPHSVPFVSSAPGFTLLVAKLAAYEAFDLLHKISTNRPADSQNRPRWHRGRSTANDDTGRGLKISVFRRLCNFVTTFVTVSIYM